MSENGAGGDEGGNEDEDSRLWGVGPRTGELLGIPGDLARLLRLGVWDWNRIENRLDQEQKSYLP